MADPNDQGGPSNPPQPPPASAGLFDIPATVFASINELSNMQPPAWTANNGEALAFFNSARTLAVSLASLENQGPRISDERTRLDELNTALELDTQAKNNEIKALKETIANQDTTYANLYASYEEQGQTLAVTETPLKSVQD